MDKQAVIKVGFCVAYDWQLLKKSVPLVYDHADTISFALDKNRTSWSGRPFEFNDQEFFGWITSIDKRGKIKVYEDDFYIPAHTPIENDNRQRTKLSEFMGAGGWHVQIDSDEYFLDFEGFRNYLLGLNANPTGNEKAFNVCCAWVNLLKKTAKGYLYVHHPLHDNSWMPFATNKPEYLNARRNSHFNHFSPFVVLHETWARGEQELWQKINSWGHDNDFLSKESYFNLWKALDEGNYRYIKNFHPLVPESWNELKYVPEHEIPGVISWLKNNEDLSIPDSYLKKKNSRLFQKLVQTLGKK